MADTTNRPIIFLAFANDLDDTVGYLRKLPDEARRLREVLKPAEKDGLCELVVRSNCTASDLFQVFQESEYRNRIAILHYGGHANGYQLLLESARGESMAADAGGLAAFLAQQHGLQLVVLNGCSTQQQARGLLDANIPAVIATSRSIDDQVATDFAHGFYQGLAGGASIRTAYNEAEAAVLTSNEGNTRALYYGESDDPKKRMEADRWPWDLYLREGSESADLWNLPEAVNNPLFGLPPLLKQDLPKSPYRYLNRFTRKEAEVFFGRGHQIRELHDRLTATGTAPILLFYGQSGVGKSSVLDAGLIPRLEQNYEVRYERRNATGLLKTMQQTVVSDDVDLPVNIAWLRKEEQIGKPLIVLLDQVEECFIRSIADVSSEFDQLLDTLNTTFGDRNRRPKGKLLLGFRKEWLAEIETHLDKYELPRTKMFLEPLDRRGIIEVVQGPDSTDRLREHYGLTVKVELPALIADDMLEDCDSAIAPTLQILLTKLWAKATEQNYEHPQFNQTLYQGLKRNGILLRDFLDQQIAAFRMRYPKSVDSGLLLDILAFHTTPLGTAGQCTLEDLQQQYTHQGDILPELLQLCQDLHLLTIVTGTEKKSSNISRLAHDTLAPLVRERFDESDLPGQRTRRILDNRTINWTDEQTGTPLDKADLVVVEMGENGTRALSAAEDRLLEVSRERRMWRKIGGIIVVVAFFMAGIFGWWQFFEATRQERTAQLQLGNVEWQRAVSARDTDQDEIRAAHLFIAAARAFAIAQESKRARNALSAINIKAVTSFPHDYGLLGALFNSDGSQVLVWDGNGTGRLWDTTKDELLRTYQHDYARGALFNDDKSQVLSWGDDDKVQLWDITKGDPLRTYQHNSVDGATFNGNGTRVLSWSNDGVLRLWEIAQEKPLQTYHLDDEIKGALFNDKGSQVLSWGDDDKVQLWDIARDKPLRTFQHDEVIRSALFNDDGSQVLSWGDDDKVKLWDITEDEPLQTYQHNSVEGAVFNGKGSQVLSWGIDGTVRLWDIANDHEPLRTYKHGSVGSVVGAVFNDERSQVLSWGDDKVQLWDNTKNEPLRTYLHGDSVDGALFNRNGSKVLSWSDDGTVRLWEITKDEPLRTYKHGHSVEDAVFNGDESRVLSWGRNGIARLWDIAVENPPRTYLHGDSVDGAVFNGDGSQVLSWSDDGTVRLWDIADDAAPFQSYKHSDSVDGAVFNGDGSQVLSWSDDGTVRLWDIADDAAPLQSYKHSESVEGAMFNDKGSQVLSWGDDGTVRLWDIADDVEPLRTYLHGDSLAIVTGASFNGNGSQVLSWGRGGTVRLWDIADDVEPLRTYLHGDSLAIVTGASFNGDGSQVLSWGRDGTVKLWDIADDVEPLRTYEHSESVEGATFNGDESQVLSWDIDATLRLWDIAEDNEPLRTYKHGDRFNRVKSALFNGDGSQVLSLSDDGMLRLWDITQDEPLRTYNHYGVTGAAFNSDGSQMLGWKWDGTVLLWDILSNDIEIDSIDEIKLKLEIRTAGTLTDQGAYRNLKLSEWLEKRKQ